MSTPKASGSGMFSTITKIHSLLDPYERHRGYIVGCFILLLGLADTLGVASIMPFLAVVGNPDMIQSNRWLALLYGSLGFASNGAFLAFLGMLVFVMLVTSLLLSAFTYWLIFRFAQMCNYRLSTRLLQTFLERPYEWFLNRHSSDLGKQVLTESGRVVHEAVMPLMNLLARGVSVVFLVILVVLIDPVMALIAAGSVGVTYGLIFLTVRHRLTALGEELYEANRQRYRIATEALGGIKDVKVAGLEARYAERFREPARLYSRRDASYRVIAEIPRYLLEALAFGGMIAVVVYLLLTREAGLGAALPLIGLYALAGYRLLPAAQQVYVNMSALRFTGPILDGMHAELSGVGKQSRAVECPGQDIAPLPLRTSIELERISFAYSAEATRPILNQLSLRIPANHTVAFVGPTGAGKTTVVDVVLGLLETDEGRLLVDGQPITDENRRAWQRGIGYVPQQIFLVDDTVAANIAFGCTPDEIDMAALQRAARVANLHDFVVGELPKGYDTEVGDRGVRLSGGQRQRIGIARAMYRDPAVLVLDEATSALDNVTEQAVMEAVHNIGKQKTIIMIAHRLSTVRSCDLIFLLEQGRLVASGTYDELKRDSASFRAMASHAG